MPISPIMAVKGSPEPTVTVTSSDEAQTLEDAGVTIVLDERNAVGVLITIEDANIRFTLGDVDEIVPTDAVGHILYAGQSLRLDSPRAIRTFQFISDAVQSVPVMHVTTEF